MDQQLRDFVQSFLQKEHDAIVVKSTTRVDSIFKSAVHALDAFFGPGLESGIVRPETPDSQWFSQMEEQVKSNAPRKPFLIRSYQHSTYGLLYRFYVSTNRIKGRDYFASYLAATRHDALAVIPRYLIDEMHARWEWNGGANIHGSGRFLEVVRFQPPTNARDLADYESSQGTF